MRSLITPTQSTCRHVKKLLPYMGCRGALQWRLPLPAQRPLPLLLTFRAATVAVAVAVAVASASASASASAFEVGVPVDGATSLVPKSDTEASAV
jgi:hypothetical protein